MPSVKQMSWDGSRLPTGDPTASARRLERVGDDDMIREPVRRQRTFGVGTAGLFSAEAYETVGGFEYRARALRRST